MARTLSISYPSSFPNLTFWSISGWTDFFHWHSGPVGPLVGLRPPMSLRHLGPLCRPSASWPYRPRWPGGGGCAPHTLPAYLEEAKASSNSDSMIGSRSCLDPDLASRSGIQIWQSNRPWRPKAEGRINGGLGAEPPGIRFLMRRSVIVQLPTLLFFWMQ